MALYAIGDVQGCDDELGALLERLAILGGSRPALVRRRSGQSRPGFAGGAAPRARVGRCGHGHSRAITICTCWRWPSAARTLRSDDTLDDDPGRARSRRAARMARRRGRCCTKITSLNVCMLHAGLAPQWDLAQARPARANSRQRCGAIPKSSSSGCTAINRTSGTMRSHGEERLRFIANCFTRLRYVDAGRPPGAARQGIAEESRRPSSLIPWFEARAGALARAAHGLRPLVDAGIFQQRRCDRPRYRLRLGRRLTALRLDVARRQARARCPARSPTVAPAQLPAARKISPRTKNRLPLAGRVRR